VRVDSIPIKLIGNREIPLQQIFRITADRWGACRKVSSMRTSLGRSQLSPGPRFVAPDRFSWEIVPTCPKNTTNQYSGWKEKGLPMETDGSLVTYHHQFRGKETVFRTPYRLL